MKRFLASLLLIATLFSQTVPLVSAGTLITDKINTSATTLTSGSTTDIGAAASQYITVTGNNTITSLGVSNAGVSRRVNFSGNLTLTYNATSLILPGKANINTNPGDIADCTSLGSGNWQCTYNAVNIPAFLVLNSTSPTNVVGNTGTTYTVPFSTVIFDKGSNFASNTFTAPVTGKYQFNAQVRLTNLAALMVSFQMNIVTTARTYFTNISLPTGGSTNGDYSISLSVLADMAATNTAIVQIRVIGGVSNTAGLIGDATNAYTFFSGYLVN
jgi:hypothetical protein